MAQIPKRCSHPKSRWSKCPDSWAVRWWEDGKQHERSFKLGKKAATTFAKRTEMAKPDPSRRAEGAFMRPVSAGWPGLPPCGRATRPPRECLNAGLLAHSPLCCAAAAPFALLVRRVRVR